MAGAGENALSRLHALPRVGEEARMRLDRVLQRRAVDLGREGRHVGPRQDRRSHDQMVREGKVDATGGLGHLTHRGDVRRDVALELTLGQFREGLDLEPLIGVLDVDRQQPADVRVVDLHSLDPDLSVLAEQVHLVAEPSQRPGEVEVVDVAAGAAQHVSVENENAHRGRPSYR
jgi:hypothetical protein